MRTGARLRWRRIGCTFWLWRHSCAGLSSAALRARGPEDDGPEARRPAGRLRAHTASGRLERAGGPRGGRRRRTTPASDDCKATRRRTRRMGREASWRSFAREHLPDRRGRARVDVDRRARDRETHGRCDSAGSRSPRDRRRGVSFTATVTESGTKFDIYSLAWRSGNGLCSLDRQPHQPARASRAPRDACASASRRGSRRGRAAPQRTLLLGWFGDSGRDLPWRRTRDPYAILVSRGDAAADAGRARRAALPALARALADGRGARGGLARRRDPGVAGARLQPARAQPSPCGAGDRGGRLARRPDGPARRRSVHGGCDPQPGLRRARAAGGHERRAVCRSAPAMRSARRRCRRSSTSARRSASRGSRGASSARCRALCPSRGLTYEPLRRQSRFEGSFRQRRAELLRLVAAEPRPIDGARCRGSRVTASRRPGRARRRARAPARLDAVPHPDVRLDVRADRRRARRAAASAPGKTYSPSSGKRMPVHSSQSATGAVHHHRLGGGRDDLAADALVDADPGVEVRAVLAAPLHVPLDRRSAGSAPSSVGRTGAITRCQPGRARVVLERLDHAARRAAAPAASATTLIASAESTVGSRSEVIPRTNASSQPDGRSPSVPSQATGSACASATSSSPSRSATWKSGKSV